MKVCIHCQRINPESVTHCIGCGRSKFVNIIMEQVDDGEAGSLLAADFGETGKAAR